MIEMLIPFIFEILSIIFYAAYSKPVPKSIINKLAEIGALVRAFFSSLKNDVVLPPLMMQNS